MPREEVQRLICEAAGPLCVRYTADAAGRVMTLDYEPAWPRRRWKWLPLSIGGVAAAVVAALLWVWGAPRPPPAATVTGMLPPLTSSGGAGGGGSSTPSCQPTMGETAPGGR
jgi:hypothetical protein